MFPSYLLLITLNPSHKKITFASSPSCLICEESPFAAEQSSSTTALPSSSYNPLYIQRVIASSVGECGLLLQKTVDATVGLVDSDNVAAGNAYATSRMMNNNGRRADGSYSSNIRIGKVKLHGGGRGVFYVSQSGGAMIDYIDLASNGNNAVLIENCNNVNIGSGTLNGGGEALLSARTEFPTTATSRPP